MSQFSHGYRNGRRESHMSALQRIMTHCSECIFKMPVAYIAKVELLSRCIVYRLSV